MTDDKPVIWFAGTPAFAAYSLERLLTQADYSITGVLTQPDRPAGRGRKIKASAVKTVAQNHGIAIAQPEKLYATAPPFATFARPDLIIVAAYGLLLPQWFLDYPRLGCINIHASLLPRWRGAAPIQRAIEAGDHETGISIMQMDAGLDTGAVWLAQSLPIGDKDNAAQLHDKLMVLGADALLTALPMVFSGQTQPNAQDTDQATYAHKLHKSEAAIDWHCDATTISRKIRAFNPYPIAHTELNGESLRIYNADILPNYGHTATAGTVVKHDKEGLDIIAGDGNIMRIYDIQFPSKPVTRAAEVRNGRNLTGQICL